MNLNRNREPKLLRPLWQASQMYMLHVENGIKLELWGSSDISSLG